MGLYGMLDVLIQEGFVLNTAFSGIIYMYKIIHVDEN